MRASRLDHGPAASLARPEVNHDWGLWADPCGYPLSEDQKLWVGISIDPYERILSKIYTNRFGISKGEA